MFKVENKFGDFKIHLFSTLNTKQTNDGIFSNKAGENFNLAKISINVRVQLYSCDEIFRLNQQSFKVEEGYMQVY